MPLPERDASDVYRELTSRRPERVERVLGGGNNQLYRVQDAEGRPYALKMYRPPQEDPRPRRQQEFEALSFLGRTPGAPVPEAIATDEAHNASLYSWVEGERPGEVDRDDIDTVLAFVDMLHRVSRQPGADELRDAAEACFTSHEIVRQIGQRRVRFAAIEADEPELQEFLTTVVDPALERFARAQAFAADADARCLSPSDFGFHNAIRSADGSLTFIDMEYFGWDDPVKLAADFVLHPGMNLERGLAGHFLAGWMDVFGAEDGQARARLEAQFPLYAIRWSMILLNEFLPERWQAKVFSGETESWEVAKHRQLTKARAMMANAAPDSFAGFVAGAIGGYQC